ncbi:MAG: tripartite tricarboxylate transporter permease, partial [Bdellovibrionales bacterium]|nr:tripartite tricarboxylate transporter permease [Bdellovibrionales bacterium]
KVIEVPKALLYPIIVMLCFLGSYSTKGSLFDVWVCFGFGFLGATLKRVGYQPGPIVLGLVLGELLEMNFRRAVLIGGMQIFIERPISLVLLLLSLLSFLFPLARSWFRRRLGDPVA